MRQGQPVCARVWFGMEEWVPKLGTCLAVKCSQSPGISPSRVRWGRRGCVSPPEHGTLRWGVLLSVHCLCPPTPAAAGPETSGVKAREELSHPAAESALMDK